MLLKECGLAQKITINYYTKSHSDTIFSKVKSVTAG